LYKSASFVTCKVDTILCATAAKIIRAFYQCINGVNCCASNINPANGVLQIVDSCENISNLYIYNLSSANAITAVYSSKNISGYDINTITGTAGQYVKGFSVCFEVFSGIIQNLSGGIITGIDGCTNVSGFYFTTWTGSSGVTLYGVASSFQISGGDIQDINGGIISGIIGCYNVSDVYCYNLRPTGTDVAAGYKNSDRLNNCTSADMVTDNAIAYGFWGCTTLMGCLADTNTSGTGNQGIGFSGCTGVINCTSINNDAYGFAACIGMSMNTATGNGTKDYHTCKVDRSGAIAVTADTVASGCNDGVNYD